MKLGRNRGYHNSRLYDSDEPVAGIGFFAWFAHFGRAFRRVLKSAARFPSSTVLLSNEERHFTLLGVDNTFRPTARPTVDQRVFPGRGQR